MVSVKKLDVCIAIVGKSGMGALEYYPENIYEIVANDLKDYINQSYK